MSTRFSSCLKASRVEEHEEQHFEPGCHGVLGDEEGEVGDGEEEEGGDEGGDDAALHPPRQDQLELDVGIGGGVLARVEAANLGEVAVRDAEDLARKQERSLPDKCCDCSLAS